MVRLVLGCDLYTGECGTEQTLVFSRLQITGVRYVTEAFVALKPMRYDRVT